MNTTKKQLANQLPPISLYIHLPWCVKKCPYCDFNSHTLPKDKHLFEQYTREYIDCLVTDFTNNLVKLHNRPIQTIFFGGGTPSLFSADNIAYCLDQLTKLANFSADCEITLEANPGTVEQRNFNGYYRAGINRISLGVQSFQADKLKQLGRIHNPIEAHNAIEAIKKAGFHNFNIDIMHGLPNQTPEDSCYDLEQAIAHEPTHISWYQLTIEPNTYFHQHTPVLPNEEYLLAIEQQGLALLNQAEFERYEVSAYAKNIKKTKHLPYYCRHNLNYWEFGDYLGIGAGAHSKLTQINPIATDNDNHVFEISRQWNYKSPFSYMKAENQQYISNQKILSQADISFEYMLNRLRVFKPINLLYFEQYTGISKNYLLPIIQQLQSKQLVTLVENCLSTTDLGKKYLDDVCQYFLTQIQ